MTRTEAQRYCSALTKRSGSNFYYSFLFLPQERREAMHAVYAFCREVDSAVDDPVPGTDPQASLARWRTELAAVYSSDRGGGNVESPVMVCLSDHIQRLDIPQEYFEEIINGVEMDLAISRYATFQDLYTYCYRVASVVGLTCLKIFGANAPESEDYAIKLGIAFQLTNILRDIRADGERGRIYVPQEDLVRFGYSEAALLAHDYNPAFVSLMEFECRRAEDYYRSAETALTEKDRQALLPAEIMRAVYHTILERIQGARYQIFSRRITLSPPRRLTIALQTWLAARR